MNFQKLNYSYNSFYAFVCVFILLSPIASFAEGGLYLKGYGGVNYTVENDFETGDALDLIDGSEVEYETGQVFGFSVGYRMHNGLAFEVDYSTRANDIESISVENFKVQGDIESSAIMLDLVYYPSYGSLFSPYFGGGLGLLKDIDANLKLNEDFFDDFNDSSLAWQAFAGLNFSVLENLSVFGEARFFSGPAPELENDIASIDIDYNNVSLMVGLNFSLN